MPVDTIWLGLVVVAGLLLAVALVSRILQTSPVSDALIALALGVAVGPVGLDLLHLGGDTLNHPLIRVVARLTLAVGVLAIALRLPLRRMDRHALGSIAVILAVGMPAMWLVTAGIVMLLLGVGPAGALLISAPLAPTDPVLASGIVSGPLAQRLIPERIRNLLLAESGVNDGLGLPFVGIALLLTYPAEGANLGTWAWHTLVLSVFGAAIGGALIGYGSGHLVRLATSRNYVRRPGLLGFSLALTGLVAGAAAALNLSAILAAFFAGLGLNWALQEEHQEPQRQAQETASRFLSLPVFLLLGTALPWDGWFSAGVPLLGAALLILLVRRVPAILAASWAIPSLHGLPDALFVGWFGPIGIAALYYALHEASLGAGELVYQLVTLAIVLSVIVHGLSGPMLSRWYARATNQPGSEESADEAEAKVEADERRAKQREDRQAAQTDPERKTDAGGHGTNPAPKRSRRSRAR